MATKPDYPPLLAPGLHKLTFEDIYDLAVLPFSGDAQRAVLFQKFKLWECEVRALGIKGTLWVDGSFLTRKPGPEDVDCVIWRPHWIDLANDTPTNRAALSRLFDHSSAKTLYGLDLYLETPTVDQLVHREAYWKGFFGYCHDRTTAKGFAEVNV
jgi:hypothetical protein